MKILHLGNIANNAYNNAKFLRRKGVQADVLSYDYGHVMAQPEWEDAEFEGEVDEYHPDWSTLDLRGFRRPDWFHDVDLNQLNARHFCGRTSRFRGQFALQWKWMRAREMAMVANRYLRFRWDYARLVHHRQDRFCYEDVSSQVTNLRYLAPLLKQYDVVQAYGFYEPKFPVLVSPRRPFVAFEHGTMRDLPFESGSNSRWISLAYKKASKIIITNADSIVAAKKMGLNNVVFIPHPVDETKCRPLATPLATALRNAHACEYLLFCPSRQNWALKGNDKVLRAFADVVTRRKLDAVLLLSRWGQEIDRSCDLIHELGIAHRVVWLPPLNKMRLIQYYNASDVVLDQFTLGVFGTTTPEAMACGKPVMLYFNDEVHKWCFPEMPPVVSAFSEQEIATRLIDLLEHGDERISLGRQGRQWIEQYHGWELVVERHLRLYQQILQ